MDLIPVDEAFNNLKSSLTTKFTNIETGIGESGTHPISITGNAGSATKLFSPITFTISGDVLGTTEFDTSGSSVNLIATINSSFKIDWTNINNKPNSLSTFGITDAVSYTDFQALKDQFDAYVLAHP